MNRFHRHWSNVHIFFCHCAIFISMDGEVVLVAYMRVYLCALCEIFRWRRFNIVWLDIIRSFFYVYKYIIYTSYIESEKHMRVR